jgi:hypothetical protein
MKNKRLLLAAISKSLPNLAERDAKWWIENPSNLKDLFKAMKLWPKIFRSRKL